MRHMLAGSNVSLCIGRAGQAIGSEIWDVSYVSRTASDLNLFRRGGNCLFPLYRYPPAGQGQLASERLPNLSDEFIQALGSSLGLSFTADGPGDLRASFGPEDVLHFIYAVLHSPEYRRRYADFLKADFPRVPLTGSPELFRELVRLGEHLALLHLLDAEGDDKPSFSEAGDNRVEKVRYVPPTGEYGGRVYINPVQYFDGVAPDSWGVYDRRLPGRPRSG